MKAIAIIRGIDLFNSSGADEIREALFEMDALLDEEFSATLGEPRILEAGGRYFSEPKIVVPVKDSPFDGANQLVFYLPHGSSDEMAFFNQLLGAFDLDLETMEELENKAVPVEILGGNVNLLWEELLEDAEQAADADESEKGGGVTVEETTVSAGEANA